MRADVAAEPHPLGDATRGVASAVVARRAGAAKMSRRCLPVCAR